MECRPASTTTKPDRGPTCKKLSETQHVKKSKEPAVATATPNKDSMGKRMPEIECVGEFVRLGEKLHPLILRRRPKGKAYNIGTGRQQTE
jgi:hypothetical protein